MPQPAAKTSTPLEQPHLEDVLGDVPRSYPVGFYAKAEDEAVEREAIDQEILAALVRF